MLMRTIKLRYDTLLLGKKNDSLMIPDALAVLLEEYAFFADIAARIEHRDEEACSCYEFVPVFEENQLGFRLCRKGTYNSSREAIQRGLQALERYLKR